jgi:hypothetical protein
MIAPMFSEVDTLSYCCVLICVFSGGPTMVLTSVRVMRARVL